MQHFTRLAGATSQILPVSIYDSTSTTGAKLAGLAYNTCGTVYYNRIGASGAATAISPVTATKGTWTSSGFVAIDGTNMPGDYELHIPDAALAAGASGVLVQIKGGTNAVPCNVYVELVAYNPQDGVHLGLTSLPNVASGSAGAVLTSGTGTAQLSVASGVASANVTAINGVATTSVTTVSAYQGTTQPVNFTGTGGSALAKVDVTDIATAAVSATTAQLGVNVVNWNGTAVATPAIAGVPSVDAIKVAGDDPDSDTTIAAAVRDVSNASPATGSLGAAVNSAASAGDPWSTAVPGSYAAGTAGYKIGTNLDAAVSTRLAPTVAARTLDVAATGEAGVDLDNIHAASGATVLTNITVPTVTTLTNLPAAPTDWLAAAAVKADAVTKIQNGLATPTNITAAAGVALAADQAVNVTKWNGTAVATPATAGYPAVTVKVGTGTGEVNVASGVVPANMTKINGTTLTGNGGTTPFGPA